MTRSKENQVVARTFPDGYILGLLRGLILSFRRKGIYADQRSVNIYMPILLKEFLFNDLRRGNGFFNAQWNNGQIDSFEGYKILPGYENKIVMAHENYIIFKDERMYYEVSITLPMVDEIKIV
jgi:hypothetical protein